MDDLIVITLSDGDEPNGAKWNPSSGKCTILCMNGPDASTGELRFREMAVCSQKHLG